MEVQVPRWVLGVVALVLAVGVGAGGTLLITGGNGDSDEVEEGTVEALGPNCDAMGINRKQGREGICVERGRRFVVVDKGSTLRLKELNARLVNIEMTDSVTGAPGAGTASASGTFVIVTLAITNKLDGPVIFDEFQEQVFLLLGGNRYSEDFDAENGPVQESFTWQGKEIQPEATQTGAVVFDVPNKVLADLNKDGNIFILNFSEADSLSGQPKVFGIIRTYE